MSTDKELKNEPLSSFCTTKEAAALLGINHHQAQRLAKDKRIISVKWGDRILLIHKPSLKAYIENKSRKGRPPGHR